MMNIERTFFISASPQNVFNAMKDSALIKEDELDRGTLRVEVKKVKATEKEFVFEVHFAHFAWGIFGINRSRIDVFVSTVAWDLNNYTCSWEWRGESNRADNTKISGQTKLTEKGDGTEVTMSANIEDSTAIIGNRIAKGISKKFLKDWSKYILRVSAWTKK